MPIPILKHMMELGGEFSHYSTITSIGDGTINVIKFVLAGCSFHVAKEGKKGRGIKALSHANLDAFH